MSKISASRVNIVYKDAQKQTAVHAVADLTLEIARGELFVVVGPSGCGKTSFLNAVAGLVPITSGTLLVDGKPVTGPGPDRAMVFQDYALFPWRTVWANVQFGLELARNRVPDAKQRIQNVIHMIGLEGFEHAYPHQLSGGMRQRAGLARALVVQPQILLMDEPFAAIDAMTREVMQQELIRIMQATGQTSIFITHSIDEALVLGDRVAVMSSRPGRVKEILTVDLPRERWRAEIRNLPAFARLRERIWHLLQDEFARLRRTRDDGPAAPAGGHAAEGRAAP